jgi:glycosyltransferase 2 family protein
MSSKNLNIKLLKVLQVIVSIFLVGYLLKYLQWEKLKEIGNNLKSPWMILPPLCIFTGLIFAAWRWKMLLHRFQHKFSFFTCYKLYCIGAFFNVFFPGAIGGDLIRIRSSKKAGLSLTESSLVVLSERVAGLFSVFILGSVFSFWVYTQSQKDILKIIVWPIWFITAGMFTFLFFVFFFFHSNVTKHLLKRSPPLFVNIFKKLVEIAQLPRKNMLWVLIFSTIFQTSDVLSSVILAHLLGMNLSPSLLFVINPAVFVATILPLSLGGLGIREGTMAHLLALFGIGLEQAIPLAFLIHVNRIIIGFIGGCIYFLSKKENKAV